MEIEENKLYSPREISDAGLIKNSKGNNDYYFVLKLIGRGVLKAKDYTFGKKNPYYKVLGKDILEYKREYEGYDG